MNTCQPKNCFKDINEDKVMSFQIVLTNFSGSWNAVSGKKN